MAPVTSLPSEVITLIVENVNKQDLYECTLTNKQFYNATNPLLWRLPALTEKATVVQFLAGLTAAKTQWIRKLTLYNNYWDNAQLWTLMAHDGLSQLEELRLISTTKLTDASLPYLPPQCRRLKTLYLWDVPMITQDFIYAVGQYCLELTKFEFYDCPGLGEDTYAALMECPLRTMYIASPPRRLQAESSMWDLVLHYPYLTELKVCIPGHDYRLAFTNRLLSAAASAWPYLETLALHGYGDEHRDDETGQPPLVDFLRYHPGIVRLYLRKCALSDTTLDAIGALHLPCLTELTITDTTLCPEALRRLIGACPELGFILCRGCELTASMFPEVGIKCSNYNHQHFYLNHLDQENIHMIRLGLGGGGGHLDQEVMPRRIGGAFIGNNNY